MEIYIFFLVEMSVKTRRLAWTNMWTRTPDEWWMMNERKNSCHSVNSLTIANYETVRSIYNGGHSLDYNYRTNVPRGWKCSGTLKYFTTKTISKLFFYWKVISVCNKYSWWYNIYFRNIFIKLNYFLEMKWNLAMFDILKMVLLWPYSSSFVKYFTFSNIRQEFVTFRALIIL